MYRVPHCSTGNKLSLSTQNTDQKDTTRGDANRSFSKRYGGDTSAHGGRSNPFSAITPLTTGLASPAANASSAFGLGSGAFASFGSSAKTPKTPGAGGTFDAAAGKALAERREAEGSRPKATSTSTPSAPGSVTARTAEHPLKATWIVWYRPPTSKYSDYEKSTIALGAVSTVENFWALYSHLKRPSLLPSVSDYHIFKKGIRPVWEDEANKRGGKWIVRLKKGVADRYWEDLLLAIVGDQFAEAGEEVCGAVLSVRSGEDVLSVWTRIDGGRNIKIRYGRPLNR